MANELAKVDSGIVEIHGKAYETVAKRVTEFRENHAGWTIKTSILENTADKVVMTAEIFDPKGQLIANGHAEESRKSTSINKTSAMENCETSAVGRALALFGMPGVSIRSADEMSDAVAQQKVDKVINWLKAHNQAVRENLDSIIAIKEGLIQDITKDSQLRDINSAAEEWFGLSEDVQHRLWVAPTKGGIFTTREREIIHGGEFARAHFGESAGEAVAEREE